MDVNKTPLMPDDLKEIEHDAERWIRTRWGSEMPASQSRGMARDVLRLLNHIRKLEDGLVKACSMLDDAVQLRDDADEWFPQIDELRRIAKPELPVMAGYNTENA